MLAPLHVGNVADEVEVAVAGQGEIGDEDQAGNDGVAEEATVLLALLLEQR